MCLQYRGRLWVLLFGCRCLRSSLQRGRSLCEVENSHNLPWVFNLCFCRKNHLCVYIIKIFILDNNLLLLSFEYLSLVLLAIFCDFFNPDGECEWHHEPCGKPCMKTCRNPSGICYNTIPALEGIKFYPSNIVLMYFLCEIYLRRVNQPWMHFSSKALRFILMCLLLIT